MEVKIQKLRPGAVTPRRGSADAAVQALLDGSLGYDPEARCDHHDHAHVPFSCLLPRILPW